MKKILSLLLALALLVSLTACGAAESTPAETTAAPTETTESAAQAWPTGKEALQGKKVIFLGNSYTFCGQNVMTIQNTEIGQADPPTEDLKQI